MPAKMIRLLVSSVLVAVTLMWAGCNQQPAVSPDQPAAALEPGAAAAAQVEVTDQMKEVLAKADEVDGTPDKTISKCAACELGMNGSQEHALQVGEYTMWFCSEDCKESYAQDVEKAVLGIKLPEPAQSPPGG